MTNAELFIGWNKALFLYFFDAQNNEEDEVSLYIDRDKIEEIGRENKLGGYEDFIRIIMLPIEERKQLYCALRRTHLGTSIIPESVMRNYRSTNLFSFASIFTRDFHESNLKCPYLIYIVFAVLMGSECYRSGRNGIGRYITEKLKASFPGHNDDRTGLKTIFDALAKQYPRFRAIKLTEHPYIGLIRYQLGLSKAQEEMLNKAMYNADLSEELPYEQWIEKIVDYVDQDTKDFLRNSKEKEVIRRRISDLRERFDPAIYEKKHQNEEIKSNGHFALAVFEDEYSELEDRLVLLTDINNKSISFENLKITKGTIDRLGEYAEYNVNHVLIGDKDKAEMKKYSLQDGKNTVTPLSFEKGCIVTFSRCNSNYLIQTNYPQRGKEIYILVKSGHDEEWRQWLEDHDSPCIEASSNGAWIHQVFGEGWEMYKSNQIEYVNRRQASANVTAITMGGGINCPRKTNVYLITALPYFEFPEPINQDLLKISIDVDQRSLNNNQFRYKIVDLYKLVIDFIGIIPENRSLSVNVNIDYKNKLKQEQFDVTGQDVIYNEEDLFKMNMWGEKIDSGTNDPYMQGLEVCNISCQQDLPQETVLYQPQIRTNASPQLIDPQDRRFYLVNLFAANCSMREGFVITEARLKKCIRYAATRFEIDTTSIPLFYRNLRFLLINNGYMNADYEQGKYQPIPPTFIKTPAHLYRNDHLYLLAGSYTYKFLIDLVNYCRNNQVNMFLHESNKNNNPVESLIPPVILLQYNFDPEEFMRQTSNRCKYYGNTAIAVNILKALPSYQQYKRTLQEIRPEVFDGRNLKELQERTTCPRIRESKTTGYGAQKWIEISENHYYNITIPDIAWAKLFCFHENNTVICTKDNRDLLFPTDLHLPSMMQRALFITNFGIPQRKKVFVCNKVDSNNNYFNLVKQYNIKSNDQMLCILNTLAGKKVNQTNAFIRDLVKCQYYELKMWTNNNRHSSNPRSLLVIYYKNEVQGFAIRINQEEFKIYFLNAVNHRFERINTSDINTVLSKFMTTRQTWSDMGYNIIPEQYMSLPPREEYQIEQIEII